MHLNLTLVNRFQMFVCEKFKEKFLLLIINYQSVLINNLRLEKVQIKRIFKS